jgi:hypothetical protein
MANTGAFVHHNTTSRLLYGTIARLYQRSQYQLAGTIDEYERTGGRKEDKE